MQPFENYTFINFLHWMTREYPEVQKLADLSNKELHQITADFERHIAKRFEGTGVKPEVSYYDAQWLDNVQAYSSPRNCGEEYEFDDPLERYRKVPLHALFLYNSMNKCMDAYIEKNWCAIHRLSANYCDIHPLYSQFDDKEDASDFIRHLTVISESSVPIGFSKLPGIFFWDHLGRSEYVSFMSSQSDEDISRAVLRIFEDIEKDPHISTVTRVKRQLEEKRTVKTDVEAVSNPWISGSFYLFALVVVLAALLVIARTVPIWTFPLVVIGALLAVSIIGAFQLRQDRNLPDKTFLELMTLTLRSLPLLRGMGKPPVDSGQ